MDVWTGSNWSDRTKPWYDPTVVWTPGIGGVVEH